jgi:NAD(P)-dependent dehydrogenase (short-subunit alcohol dehydrogenase family)
VTNDLDGTTVVLTGASSGIGAVAARSLAARGATVVPMGRDPQRTAQVAAAIGAEPLVADFARLDDVRRAAQEVLRRCPRIDVLALNAGGVFPRRAVTADGHETTFQVNHLAGFALTMLLMDRLRESATTGPVRVVLTSSAANLWGDVRPGDLDWQRRRWSSLRAYATTKLENILFAAELARRTADCAISAFAFHPGVVASDFGRDSGALVGLVYRTWLRRLLVTDAAGAVPLEVLAAGGEAPAASGTYFDRLAPAGRTARQARDGGLAAELWERSLALC